MFKHLPKTSDEAYKILAEESAVAFAKFDPVMGSSPDLEDIDLWEVARTGCSDFVDDDPNMARAVYGCGLWLSGMLIVLGMKAKNANLAGILGMVNAVALLRFLERYLEARELESKFEM